MPQELLNRAQIAAALQQVGSKAMAESMGAYPLIDPHLSHGGLDRLIHYTLVDMMPPRYAATRDGATFPCTARWVRNASIFPSPPARSALLVIP